MASSSDAQWHASAAGPCGTPWAAAGPVSHGPAGLDTCRGMGQQPEASGVTDQGYGEATSSAAWDQVEWWASAGDDSQWGAQGDVAAEWQAATPNNDGTFIDYAPVSQGAQDPNREKRVLWSAGDGSWPTDRTVRRWAQTYPVECPLVVDEALQMEYLTSIGSDGITKAHGLRFWPPGGRRRKSGNVSVFLPAGDVWIVGNQRSRDYFRGKISDWTTPVGA